MCVTQLPSIGTPLQEFPTFFNILECKTNTKNIKELKKKINKHYNNKVFNCFYPLSGNIFSIFLVLLFSKKIERKKFFFLFGLFSALPFRSISFYLCNLNTFSVLSGNFSLNTKKKKYFFLSFSKFFEVKRITCPRKLMTFANAAAGFFASFYFCCNVCYHVILSLIILIVFFFYSSCLSCPLSPVVCGFTLQAPCKSNL